MARARNTKIQPATQEHSMATITLDADRAAAVAACQDQACLTADSGRIDPHHVGCPVGVLEGVL